MRHSRQPRKSGFQAFSPPRPLATTVYLQDPELCDTFDVPFEESTHPDRVHDTIRITTEELATNLSNLQRLQNVTPIPQREFRALRLARRDLLRLRSRAFEVVGQMQDAERDVNEVLVFFPADPRAWFLRGKHAAQRGDYPEALEFFTNVIILNPQKPKLLGEAYYHRAQVKTRIRRHESALKDYEKAVEVDSEHSMAHFQLGSQFFTTGKRRDGTHPFLDHVDLGEAESQSDDLIYPKTTLETAIFHLGRAIELDGSLWHALAVRSYAFCALRKFRLGIEDCTRALESEELQSCPNEWAEILTARGIARIETEDFDQAFEDFEKALEIRSHYCVALHGKARALRRMEKLEESSRVFVEALETALKQHEEGSHHPPDLHALFREAAECDLTLGHSDEALATVRRAREFFPNDKFFRETQTQLKSISRALKMTNHYIQRSNVDRVWSWIAIALLIASVVYYWVGSGVPFP